MLCEYWERGLIEDIVKLSENFIFVNFVWSRRSGNMLAHRLAMFGLTHNKLFISDSIPATFEDTVLVDLNKFTRG